MHEQIPGFDTQIHTDFVDSTAFGFKALEFMDFPDELVYLFPLGVKATKKNEFWSSKFNYKRRKYKWARKNYYKNLTTFNYNSIDEEVYRRIFGSLDDPTPEK